MKLKMMLALLAIGALSQANTPGPEHKVLAGMAGNWNVEVKFWMRPGAKPATLTGTMKNEMVLGGRFLRSHAKGGAIESLVMHGFDRRHKRYTLVGFDTGGTYYVTAAGTYDAKTRTLTMRGRDEGADGKVQEYEFITRFVDKDTYVTECYFTNPEMTRGQKRFKMMESTAVRAK